MRNDLGLCCRPSVSAEELALRPEADFLAGLSPADQQRAAADPHECMLMRLENERQLRLEAVSPCVKSWAHNTYTSTPGWRRSSRQAWAVQTGSLLQRTCTSASCAAGERAPAAPGGGEPFCS